MNLRPYIQVGCIRISVDAERQRLSSFVFASVYTKCKFGYYTLCLIREWLKIYHQNYPEVLQTLLLNSYQDNKDFSVRQVVRI